MSLQLQPCRSLHSRIGCDSRYFIAITIEYIFPNVLIYGIGNEDQCRQTITKVCDEFETREVGRSILSEIEYQTENVTKETSGRLSKVDEKRTSSSPYKASWWDQFKALLWRSFLAVIKEPMIMQVRIFQTIVSGLNF